MSTVEDDHSIEEQSVLVEDVATANDVDESNYTAMEVDNQPDLQEHMETVHVNEESTNIVDATRIKSYPSGKELFHNFGDDLTDDVEWLERGTPFERFEETDSRTELQQERKTPKKLARKPKIKSARKIGEDEVPADLRKENAKLKLKEINLRKENAKLKKFLAQSRRQKRNITAVLQRRLIVSTKTKNVCKHTVDEFLAGQKCEEPLARTMIKLQLHKGSAEYTKEEKDLAKHMFFYSASGYSRIRKAGLNLPSDSSVRKWISETEIRPGFCEEIFSSIKQNLIKLPPSERECCLKFDEMSIKKFQEYSVKYDLIEGLVDVGPLGRHDESAVHVLLFCVDSINVKNPWRQIVAYFLTGKNSTHKEIVELTEVCLHKLKNVGASVKLITCDQGGPNRKAFSHWKISPEESSFTLNDDIYFASFDWPHLIKRLISQLRSHKFIYVNGEIIMSFQDLFDTWQFDRNLNSSNLLCHITYAHFYPNNFEAMNVKRAFQMLSARFAASISTAGQSGALKSTSWQASVHFVSKMNKVIDAMNVSRLNSWKGEKGLLSDYNTIPEQLLTAFIEWCSKWSTSEKKVIRPPCFHGMITTVKAILSAYRAVKESHPDFELATALCNQDSVEHTFGKIRGRGGFNRNPTARMVRLTLRHILSSGCIYGSSRGNVICAEASSLTHGASLAREIETNDIQLEEESILPVEMDTEDFDDNVIAAACEDISRYEEENSDDPLMNMTEQDSFDTRGTYERNAVAYFAGYISRYGYGKTKCDSCRERNMKTPMEGLNDNELYIQLREYEHEDEDGPEVQWLSRPTDEFANIVHLQLAALNSCFKKYWHHKDLKKKLLQICEKHVQDVHGHWFDQNDDCYPHRIQMLDFMLRVKVYSITKKNNNQGRERTNTVASRGAGDIKTKSQKLRNLKHL